jgi:ribosome-associated translation inhibitor RaiA
MQVNFESRTPDSSDLREMAIRRLQFKLRRLSWLIPRARVQFSDMNGPRGGIDKRIQVELNTDVAGTLVATSVASDWRTALEKALTRVVRLLLKTVTKERKKGTARARRLQLTTDLQG